MASGGEEQQHRSAERYIDNSTGTPLRRVKPYVHEVGMM
jgi:hypothetical protein